MYDKKIKALFIIVAVLLVIGFGTTLAYFTSSTDFENEFHTGVYQTQATETFTSPENWLPGDEIPKTLTITNSGNVNVKARVCISENWESANGNTLENIVNGESAAIINLDNLDDWTKRGNCYLYNDTLEPGDTTSSFISSVKFNPNIEANVECNPDPNDENTKICESKGDGYDNATYTLTLRVETIQANMAGELWNPIHFVSKQNQNQITVGDEIRIDNEHFYVVSSDSNKTVLLAKYNLLVGDVFDYDKSTINYTLNKTLSSSDTGYGLQNSEALGWIPLGQNETTVRYIGVVQFSGTNYWDNSVCEFASGECTGIAGLLPEYATNGASYSGNPYPYVYRSNIGNSIAPSIVYDDPIGAYGYVQNNGYTISYFVEQYKNKLIELGAPSTITSRLLSEEEAVSLGCSETDNFCSSTDYENNPVSGTAPSWVYSTSYWLGSAGIHSSCIWSVDSDGGLYYDPHPSSGLSGCRPAIEIPTSELN